MNDKGLRDEINKRLTLNWLIQGASQHAGMTLHHLVRDELGALNPRLLRLYDQFALVNLLQYWHADAILLVGWPPRFWRRAASNPRHPFFTHPLLSKFGEMLAATGRRRALERSNEKGLTRVPILFSLQALYLIRCLRILEAPHRSQLIQLAKKATSTVWRIPIDQLDGELTRKIVLGKSISKRSMRGEILRSMVTGFGGVQRRGDSLIVCGIATNWHLLTKELVKGTAELICLHGLNDVGDNTYKCVLDAADRIEYEPWMLQTGGELWRRLLALIPGDRSLAHVLMHLARLPAEHLETMIEVVIEQPESARQLLDALGK